MHTCAFVPLQATCAVWNIFICTAHIRVGTGKAVSFV